MMAPYAFKILVGIYSMRCKLQAFVSLRRICIGGLGRVTSVFHFLYLARTKLRKVRARGRASIAAMRQFAAAWPGVGVKVRGFSQIVIQKDGLLAARSNRQMVCSGPTI